MEFMQKLLIPVLLTTFLASCSLSPKRVTLKNGLPETTVTREGRFEVIPVVGNFAAKRAVLANGLKLVVLEDHSSPTFAYQTWFRVGSRNEIMGKTGLAHFFEHLMFKGTKNHKEGEFDALLEAAGVEGENAFTSNDHTVYLQELPKKHLDLIIGLESDRMVNLLVNDESFKTEREVVKNERRFRKENSPEGIIYEALFETAFIDSPYHWPVIGYEQDLNMMSSQDARDFYETHYSPDRATIVVVGDVDADEVLRKVEAAYGKFAAKNTPDGEIKRDPEQTAQRRKKIPLNIQTQKLWMAYKVPGSDSPDTAVIELIQGILSDGMSSRFTRALVDTGIASSANSGSFDLRDPGLFSIMIDLQKGKSALLAEQVVRRELERLKDAPVRDEELTRAKNAIRFHHYQSLGNANGMAHFIGDLETFPGKLELGLKVQQDIQAVTAQQIQEVAARYFDTKKLTVIIGVPKGQ